MEGEGREKNTAKAKSLTFKLDQRDGGVLETYKNQAEGNDLAKFPPKLATFRARGRLNLSLTRISSFSSSRIEKIHFVSCLN